MFRVAVSFAVLFLAATAGADFTAGTAKTVITPDLSAGNPTGVMGDPLTGVTNDIYARVLVLNDGTRRIALVTYDLNCLDVATPLLRVRLRDELGIAPECFIPLATHNHCAPIQIVPDNFAYGRLLADKIFDMVKQAIANETGPVTIKFGAGQCYFLVNMGNAPIDYETQVLSVEKDGKPIAVFFNHPSHPIQEDFQKVGTGHPGYAVEAVEAAFPGALGMYADAAGGNQFPRNGMRGDAETVRRYGRELAEVVVQAARGPMRDVTGPLSSALETIPLPLDEPLPREEARKLAAFFPSDIGYVPYPQPHRGNNWVRALNTYYDEKLPFPKWTTDLVCTDDGFLLRGLEDKREFPCKYEETIVARIGELIFVAMQGEVCTPIGMRIKDAFRYEHPIMVGAYMGEHNLYIPTREIVRLGLYQANVIQTQYASPVGWAPSVEREMIGGVKRMVREALER